MSRTILLVEDNTDNQIIYRRALLADERTKHIPILALTAHALPADRVVEEVERVSLRRAQPK